MTGLGEIHDRETPVSEAYARFVPYASVVGTTGPQTLERQREAFPIRRRITRIHDPKNPTHELALSGSLALTARLSEISQSACSPWFVKQ
jgi:hypothetical protein